MLRREAPSWENQPGDDAWQVEPNSTHRLVMKAFVFVPDPAIRPDRRQYSKMDAHGRARVLLDMTLSVAVILAAGRLVMWATECGATGNMYWTHTQAGVTAGVAVISSVWAPTE